MIRHRLLPVLFLVTAVGCKGGDGDGGTTDGVTTPGGGLGSFELDPSYGDGGVVRLSRDVSSDEILQATWTDAGTVLLAGSTSSSAHRREGLLVHLLPDGTRDTGWGSDGFAFLPVHDQARITDLEPLADGSVLVAGTTFYGIRGHGFVARLDPTGQLDASFGDGGLTAWEGDYNGTLELARTSDGTLFTLGGGTFDAELRRLSADGALDAGFGTEGAVELSGEARELLVTDDDDLLALVGDSSSSGVHRLTPSGQPVSGFGDGGVAVVGSEAWAMALSPAGDELVVTGSGSVLKLRTAGGAPVSGFGTGGVVGVPAEDELVQILWLDGGDLVLLEAIELTFPGALARTWHRLAPDGTPRTLADPNPSFLNGQARFLEDGDGLLVAGSSRDALLDETEAFLAALNADGSVDVTFGTDGVARHGSGASPEVLWDMAPDPDGGVVSMGMAVTDSILMRTDAGAPDPGFGEGGIVDTSRTLLYFNGIAVDDQGRTVGPSYHFSVTRLLADGAPDESWGVNGATILRDGYALMADVLVDRQQRVVVAGEAIQEGPVLLRALSDGSLDPSFGAGGEVLVQVDGYAAGTAVLEEPDGSLVMTGLQLFPDGIFVAKVSEDGTPDPSFGDGGVASAPHEIRPFRLIARRGGGYLASGHRSWCGDVPDCLAVVAFTADGQLDTGFGSGGIATVPSTYFTAWSGIVELDDGRILLGGAREVDHGEELTVWSLTASGAPDPTFGDAGMFTLPGRGRVTSMLPDGDGVLVGGWRFTEAHGTDAVILRLMP